MARAASVRAVSGVKHLQISVRADTTEYLLAMEGSTSRRRQAIPVIAGNGRCCLRAVGSSTKLGTGLGGTPGSRGRRSRTRAAVAAPACRVPKLAPLARSPERGGSTESVLVYRRRLQRRLGDRPRLRYEHLELMSGNIEFAGGRVFSPPHAGSGGLRLSERCGLWLL
jgi:hypothetical protein